MVNPKSPIGYNVVVISTSPRAKDSAKHVPQIMTADGKPLSPKILGVGHNLQEFRKFVALTPSSNGTRWAKVFFGDNSQITQVQALPDPNEMSAALLRDPKAAIQQIRDNLNEHVSRLPPEWTLSNVQVRDIGLAFAKLIGNAVAIERANGDPMTADQMLRHQGIESSHAYYATVILLKANAILQHGTVPEIKLSLPLSVKCGPLFSDTLEMAASKFSQYRGAHQGMMLLQELTNMLRANNGDPPIKIPPYVAAQ